MGDRTDGIDTKDKARAQKAEYYSANKDKINARKRADRAANGDKIRALYREYARTARARKRAAATEPSQI